MAILEVLKGIEAKLREAGGSVPYEQFREFLPEQGAPAALEACRKVFDFRLSVVNGEKNHTVSIKS